MSPLPYVTNETGPVQSVNHPAKIWGKNTATLTEDSNVQSGELVATGTLNIVDADFAQSFFAASTQEGRYGTLTLCVNGHWEYAANNYQYAIQSLGYGDVAYDSFIIQSADGTQHKICVKINGVNDKAYIRGDDRGQVTEDCVNKNGKLTTEGKLCVKDIDACESYFIERSYCGDLGKLKINANGNWIYEANNDQKAIQALGEGDSLYESFVVKTVDGSTHTIKIKINGVNDSACIEGEDRAQVTEDVCVNRCGNLTAEGKLTIKDIDIDESYFIAKTYYNELGALRIDACGNWEYKVKNNLNEIQDLDSGECVIDTFCVESADGTKHTIKIKINGSEDPKPPVAYDDTYEINADSQLNIAAIGVLENDTDPNSGDTLKIISINGINSNTSKATSMSSGAILTLNEDGSLFFDPNGAYDKLPGNKTAQEQVSYTVSDSTGMTSSAVITITINGKEDAAHIGGDDQAELTEDTNVINGNLTANGVLTIFDIDEGESAFKASSQTGLLGDFTLDTEGKWQYIAKNDQPGVQSLGEGTQVTETFNIESVDGTAYQINVVVNGKNDAASISGEDTGAVTEDVLQNGKLFDSGKLDVQDVDANEAAFVESILTGNYGKFTLQADGNWQFEADNSQNNIQSLAEGETVQDIFTVESIDGTTHQVTITLTGANDEAIIGGIDTGIMTEDVDVDAGYLKASGELTISDVDSNESSFVANTLTGSLGTLTIDIAGNWQYQALNSQTAIQSLAGGTSTQDVFTVESVDGTTHQVTLTINGTNDTALISGTDTGAVTEDNAQGNNLKCSGQLSISDIDTNEAKFAPATLSGSLGTLTLKANGNWDYSATNTQSGIQSLGAGKSTQDIFTIQSVDGTSHQITITINGVNDAAVIGGAISGSVTEDVNVINGNLVTTGSLTISDVDTGQASFVASNQTGALGSFSMDTSGNWQYQTLNSQSVIQSLGAGQSTQESFTVQSIDGTSKQVTLTINGANDPAVIGGTSTGSVTEDTNVKSNKISTSGTLTITDVDTGQASFVKATLNSAVGTLSIQTNGSWTYDGDNKSSTIQALNKGQTLIDNFTVSSLDGTTKVISITINGVNEVPPVILDMNHDGEISLISVDDSQVTLGVFEETPVENYDLAMGWVAPEDGILVYDPNGLGYVADIEQISFTSYVPGDEDSDLEGLFAFDSNENYQLDYQDDAYDYFGVWQDANSNGIVDEGEYASLAERGIAAINLLHDNQVEEIAGNFIMGYSTYETFDGEEFIVADAELRLQAISQEEDSLGLEDVISDFGKLDFTALEKQVAFSQEKASENPVVSDLFALQVMVIQAETYTHQENICF